MTEEIIIDGVDVSKCKFYDKACLCHMIGPIYCEGENCYFKQLQISLEENKNLRHKLKANENRIKDVICICKQCIESED